MQIIKCHICKLDKNSCNLECVELEDVSSLYIEGKSEKDAVSKFCTKHKCIHNPSGVKCIIENCILDLQ